MKKIKLLTILSAFTLAMAGALGLASLKENKKAELVSAATNRTVYYAVDSSIVGSYTVKLNANVGDGNTWLQSNMTKTSKTFHGMDIYQGSFDERYGGVDAMQFQLYNGSNWVSQEQPISSWKTYETYSGRMYIHGREFKDYAYDTSTISVYVDGFDWSDMYFHVYDDVCDYYTGWPGYHTGFDDPKLAFNGGKLQKFTFPIISGKNTKFIFNDNGSHQSDSFSPQNNAYYYHNGSAWVADTGDRATAAAFVWDLNTARMAVTASGSTKAYSICGLTPSTWVSRYNSLSSAKSYVDFATIYTYKNASSTGADTTVTFAEVMAQLTSMASPSSSSRLFVGDSNTNSLIVIVLFISMISVAAIGGYFFIRKRRAN